MADQRARGIAWTDETWNPVRGCSRVSAGCVNCYAEAQAARFCGPGLPYEGLVHRVGGEARWTGKVVLVPERLADPLCWKRPQRVFVNSMSDMFHESLSNEQIATIVAVMSATPHVTYQVLTKRAPRMKRWFAWMAEQAFEAGGQPSDFLWALRAFATRYMAICGWPIDVHAGGMDWPPPNLWLGVSVEDQATADERIPLLLDTPAAVRWVSYEPALGPVDFYAFLATPERDECLRILGHGAPAAPGLSWVVIGGESGHRARPFDLSWARSTIAQCRQAGVAAFVKQLGSYPVLGGGRGTGGFAIGQLDPSDQSTGDHRVRIRLKSRAGADPAEWPEELRVREFPGARRAK